MSGTVTIQRMEYQDVPFVAELEQSCFTAPWSAKLIEECLGSSSYKVWLLKLQEGQEAVEKETVEKAAGGKEAVEKAAPLKIIGYCIFRVIAGEGDLMRIAVDGDYRSRGYARKLMEILVADVRKNQVQAVTLEVRASNLFAVNLYKSYGFQIEAIRRGYYTNPQEDALIMWRRKF